MADTDTKNVSLALYRYLCQNIVGTENHVKTIRLLNNVRDNVTSTNSIVAITSGSFGEGLELRGSDLDMMDVTKCMEVYEYEKKLFMKNVAYFRMETDDVKPGFTQLLVEANVIKNILEFCEEINGKHYLSSSLFKHKLLAHEESNIIHGPCISDKTGQFDCLIGLHCKTWISQASQWITRSNNSWPSYNVKQSIIKHGVLFVPIGVKGSPMEDIEWRISFSVGEKMLMNIFTHTQLLCYAVLKILLKDAIATYTECSDLLCSYFLKTIIFWLSEELPQSVWKPDNLIPCVMRCFNRLIYCVQYSVCLHYFIPENNMFENKIEGHAREILLERLYALHTYGWRCVFFSDQLSNFHESMWMDNIKPNTLRTNEVAKILNSKFLCMLNSLNLNMEICAYKRILHQLVFCNQCSHKYLYLYHLSVWCGQYIQCVPLSNTMSSNKHQYKQYHSCYCRLLQNIYHDAVSGWLMLASFFYKSKQYNKALHILMYALSKCTPEKLYNFMDMTDSHYQLLKLKLFQEKSTFRLLKIMFLKSMQFKNKSLITPDELQMEVENGDCYIPSIVYAYFLKCLCHYHLKNVKQCQDCILALQLIVAENVLIEKDKSLQSVAYNILGIALQLSGNHEAACQAFMQSFEIFPDQQLNTSIKRL